MWVSKKVNIGELEETLLRDKIARTFYNSRQRQETNKRSCKTGNVATNQFYFYDEHFEFKTAISFIVPRTYVESRGHLAGISDTA